ncbi:MAG TPA: PLDc N-terminal domain-containing protein, partial [Planctomycetota bacterium]|nr:PLDc N-terminal domain-containing protein [Planctomycetota bacterium]
MPDIATILTALLAAYALLSAIFIVSENRRPQATLAWMLAFFAAPGLGLLFYLLFGRDRKAFSRRRKLLLQELSPHALPVLEPVLSRQTEVVARIGRDSPAGKRLVTLVQ